MDELDYIVSGVAPFNNALAVLSYLQPEQPTERPELQLRLIAPRALAAAMAGETGSNATVTIPDEGEDEGLASGVRAARYLRDSIIWSNFHA